MLQQNQYSEPLLLLKKYHTYLQSRPQPHTQFLVHERLIYLLATTLSSTPSTPPTPNLDLLLQLTTFINKINLYIMTPSTTTSPTSLTFTHKLNLISKCIDMLFYPCIRNTVRPVHKLLQLRALCFNNLSCLYKQNRQTEDALKSLQTALQIQQTLFQQLNHIDTHKSLTTTYINKCVLLSSLSMHEQALQAIKISLQNIDKYRGRYSKDEGGLGKREEKELRHMEMLAWYNLGVEYEYMAQGELAAQWYQRAGTAARELGEQGVAGQVREALRGLRGKRGAK